MRKGSGTALSDKIKYLGVFCGKRAAGTQVAGRNRSCGQRAGCSLFPADGGGGASGRPDESRAASRRTLSSESFGSEEADQSRYGSERMNSPLLPSLTMMIPDGK